MVLQGWTLLAKGIHHPEIQVGYNYSMDYMIKLVRGDITQSNSEAIVNSANETLLGDDGVDGAIHIAAGPQLREYCKTLGGCKVGEVKVTPSFNLPHKFILHTVGPQYGNESEDEAELLKTCYRQSLRIADELKVKSVSFPSISTGQYGYPIDEAAEIALKTIDEFLQTEAKNLEEVVLVLYPSEEFNDHRVDDFIVYLDTARQLQIPAVHSSFGPIADDYTVYSFTTNAPQPELPLKPSSPLEVLAQYIGENKAREVRAGRALVTNPWTGRTYVDDEVYLLPTE